MRGKYILYIYIKKGEFAGENSSLCVNDFNCFSAGNHKVFRTTEEAWDWPKSIWFSSRLKFGDSLQF
jgi:hypothetical protein